MTANVYTFMIVGALPPDVSCELYNQYFCSVFCLIEKNRQCLYSAHDSVIVETCCQKTHPILRWRHNGRNSVPNHQPHHCLLNLLFRRRSKKTSKLRVTGLCAWNSPMAGEFPAQMASNAENVSIWWRHHDIWWWRYDVETFPYYWSLVIGIITKKDQNAHFVFYFLSALTLLNKQPRFFLVGAL